jgi:transposase
MVPTLATVLGVKGHRPVVGTRDCKDLLYVCASINCINGRLHTRTLENRQADNRRVRKRGGISKARRMQQMFARHLQDVAAAYPAQRIVMIVDNAPWHRGQPINDVLAHHPLLQLYRLPSYSPQLNVIERLWKPLRRRATHNRLFDELSDLKTSVRGSLRYFQRLNSRLIRLVQNCYPKKPTVSSGA